MAERAPITILIPTKNEEINLPFALASVVDWAEQVFVLDCGSSDRTEEITKQYGAEFVYHAWEGYARQKNWALDNLPITSPWVFILDADELITPTLRDELIRIATSESVPEDGFYVNRFLIFLGKRIRHCGYYPSWNVRFFRRGKAWYEERQVHEHMIVNGRVGYIRRGEMEHHDRRGLEHFIAKHNEYSTLEAQEIYRIQQSLDQGTIKFGFWEGPIERRRWVKHRIWPRVPARSFVRWFYMYILQLGCFDGRAGFHLCLLLAQYEHQITLKLDELRKLNRGKKKTRTGQGALADSDGKPAHPAPVDRAPPIARLAPRAQITRPPPREPMRAPQPPPQPSPVEVGAEAVGEPDQRIMDQYREKFATANADERDTWPYPKHIYVLRLVWFMVWKTVWKICWRRIPILRTMMLRIFGAKVKFCAMAASTWIEMPWDLELGDHVLVGPRVHLYNLGGLKIGDHTVLSQDVYVCGGTHDYTDPSYPLIRKKITIGNYVWIAAGAFIHPGVKIGDGAVIGARAVVTRDVAPWTIVSGNPARLIKTRIIRSVAEMERTPPVDAQTTPGPEMAGPSV